METQQAQSSVYEKTIINIMHKLPEERITELVNFARFLEFQHVRQVEPLTNEENFETEEKWDRLLAQPEAKRVMREMAYEALDDYHEGKTTDIVITEDGRLAPA